MSDHEIRVVVSSGDRRPENHEGVEFAHNWTSEGVVAECTFTGAHLLHLAIAGCVLNDVHREATRLGIPVTGVRVSAEGDFNRETWQSTGVRYSVEVSSEVADHEIDHLLEVVDGVAEIPKALRQKAVVIRV